MYAYVFKFFITTLIKNVIDKYRFKKAIIIILGYILKN